MSDPVTLEDICGLFRASQAEADRRAAEADQRLAKLERIAANTSREVAGLTSRWGQFVENLVPTGDTVAIANDGAFRPTAW